MSELPVLKIFLSSPGDVAEERALAEFVFRRLADEIADVAVLRFLIWEHEPLFGHAGFQQQIERPSQSDLVVTILWSRLGTRLPADFAPEPGELPPTGTEFEINDALTAYARTGKPNLLIYRKTPGPQIALGSENFAERSDQYRRLDEFCRRAFYDEQGAIKVAHHSFTDSRDFERRLAAHVRRWVDRVLHIPHSERFRPFWRGESPFRGLQSFDAEHQSVYFGRSEAISDLTRRIRDAEAAATQARAAKLLLVQGMSGSGKTSLFKAGLLPRLALRPVEGIAQWLTVQLHPSESDPALREFGALGVLATRLSECIPSILRLGTVHEIAESLFSHPERAASTLEDCIAADAKIAALEPRLIRLIIYIDQLEETFSNPAAAASEASLVAAIVALSHSPSIWVAATIRSDFIHRLEAHPDLMQAKDGNASYTLLPPRPDELAEMIREPARAAGLVWEERGGVSLDQELLRDAAGSPEALPLLEYTLAELYERREGRLLRWSEYGGGLKGALIAAADEVVDGSTAHDEAAFREVMRELVGVGEDGAATRRYASMARFSLGSSARALLDRLVARRLCVTTDEGLGDGPVTSLAHEALIRSWPRAQVWLQQETSLLRVRDEMTRDAAVWDYHDRGDGWLGVAPQKIAAIRQVEDAGLMPSGVAAEYASQSRRRGSRNAMVRRAALAGICSLTVIAVIAAWLALKQRNVARSEAATSGRTTQFMVGLFKLADPGENRGNSVTVKEVLDKGAKEIRDAKNGNSLEREPRVRAELLTAMGEAYTGLGLYSSAEDLLKQARADVDTAAVPDEVRVRTLLASGTAQQFAGDFESAEKLVRAAVDLARKKLEPSNPLRSAALSTLTDVLVQLGKSEEAIQLGNEALTADRKRGPEGAAVLANTLTSLGAAYFYRGDLKAADAPMREALRICEQTFGERHAVTALALNDFAVLLYQSGRYEEAASLYQRTLAAYREIYGAEHPEVATVINNIGRSDLMAGHVEAAEPLLRQALAMTEKFTDNQDALVSPLNSLAMIDAYHGRLDAARREIERAATIARLPNHGELLDQVLLNQADIEFLLNNQTGAASLMNEARSALENAHPDSPTDNWRYAVWDSVNAQFVAANGDAAAALSGLERAQTIIVQRFGPNGFYSLLTKRRAAALPQARKS